jgi:VIT1/CCC1 family predicted Fe2+/Mn2+ transporter
MPRHKKHPSKQRLTSSYIRSSFFGIEDSLVSTTGLIAGISVGTQSVDFILLAGFVAVAVEAISMSAGEFLSEETEQDLNRSRHKSSPIIGGAIMFFSYSAAGMVPILPIMLFPIDYAIYVSMAAALVGLFLLGLVKGALTRRDIIRSGIQVLVVGGVAAMIGAAVGIFFKV